VTGGTEISGNAVARVAGQSSIGGGLYITATSVFAGDVSISNNAAETLGDDTLAIAVGGGIALFNGTLAIAAAEISGNRAAAEARNNGIAFGGAIYAVNSTVQSRASRLIDNQSRSASSGGQAAGGGLVLIQSTFNLDGDELRGNRVDIAPGTVSVTAIGGAAFINGSSTGSISGAVIADNHLANSEAVASPMRGAGLALLIQGGTASLELVDSEISGNTITGAAAGEGGGVFADESGGTLSLSIRRSLIAANRIDSLDSADGGGLYLMSTGASSVQIANTTISGNVASGATGGRGGGLAVLKPGGETDLVLTIANSTLSANQASDEGGALHVNDQTVDDLVLAIDHSIVAGNQAPAEPECRILIGAANAILSLFPAADDCTAGGANPVFGDPLLGPLADNGGPTRTHMPAAGSPARDGGSATGCANGVGSIETDQRGMERPLGACDLGAVEAQ
jgi:hypothetical protein